MKSRPSGELRLILVIGAVVALMLFEAQSLPSNVRMAPNLLGFASMGLILLLVVGEIYPPAMKYMGSPITDLVGAKESKDPAWGDDEVSDRARWIPVLRIMAYVAGFWLLVVFFGLILIPPIFVICFLVFEARVRFKIAVLSSLIACTILITGLLLLNVEMWLGAIPETIPGVLGGSILPSL